MPASRQGFGKPPPSKGLTKPTMRFPLDRVQEILDQYDTLGKGLHITEFTPTSAGQKITGSPREGVWDEAAA